MYENRVTPEGTSLYHKSMGTDNPSGTAVVVMSPDDEDLKLIRSTLKKVGFHVVNSETGNEVLALLKAQDPSLNLVVADPATPGLDFRQLLRKLHEADSPARVLCVCEEVPTSADDDQIGAHLRRPFRRSHLLASILDATEKPLARTA
jgi:CheY-like chemotaxis protein